MRMNNNRTLKKIFNTKPDGVRSVGRPKMRWEDGLDQDIRMLGVKNWKKVALNREKGHSFLRKPGPTRGCRDNDVMLWNVHGHVSCTREVSLGILRTIITENEKGCSFYLNRYPEQN